MIRTIALKRGREALSGGSLPAFYRTATSKPSPHRCKIESMAPLSSAGHRQPRLSGCRQVKRLGQRQGRRAPKHGGCARVISAHICNCFLRGQTRAPRCLARSCRAGKSYSPRWQHICTPFPALRLTPCTPWHRHKAASLGLTSLPRDDHVQELVLSPSPALSPSPTLSPSPALSLLPSLPLSLRADVLPREIS